MQSMDEYVPSFNKAWFLSPQDFGPSSEIIGDLAKQTKSELIA